MTAVPVLRLGRGMGSARWRASRALLISLLAHALLLSLTLGGEGLGLPGLGLPWKERRAQEPDLQVLLVAPPAVAPPMPSAAAATVEAAVQAPGDSSDAQAAPAGDTAPLPSTASLRADSSSDLLASSQPEPALIAMPHADAGKWAVPATPVAAASAATITPAASAANPQPATTAAPPSAPRDRSAEAALQLQARMDLRAWERALERAELERSRQEVRQQAEQQAQARQEAARLEAARMEAERQEALKQAAARLELQRQEAARLEAARAEAARLEAQRQATAREEAAAAAARQETARQEALKQEAARAEAARQEAERLEAARQATARQEAARAEAARQEAERQEGLRQAAALQEAARQAVAAAEAAKLAAAQAELEKREARLRAIGRQLNEEADRRAAASTLRRGRLFGRSDANAEMLLYAEAWARKIQLNAGVEALGDAVRQPYTDPMVTVAIRSDGTVEAVSFVRSSGAPALDEAIRRVVLGQANYPPFQPALAREYDVIEIRRTWHFDMAIRLY
jgi:TonB family protein